MPVLQLTKSAIDLGLVAQSIEPMLQFYRDTLGLTLDATLDMPGGTTMYRLGCGDTVIKILTHEKTPKPDPPPADPGVQPASDTSPSASATSLRWLPPAKRRATPSRSGPSRFGPALRLR